MKFSRMRLELRTVKMTIVIFICIGIYLLLGQGHNTSAMMVAAITAIINYGNHWDPS